jgi:hypothetical protein
MSKIWESIKKIAKWVKESIGNMFGKIDDKRIDSIADSDVVVEVEEAAELPDLAKLKKMNEDVLYEGDVEKQIDALEKVDEDLTDDVAEVIEAGTAEVDKGKVKDLNEFFTNNQVVIESTIDPHSGKETRNAVTVVPLNRKTNTVKIKRMSGKDLAKMAKDTKSLQKDVEDAVENLTDTKWGEKRLADLDKIIKRISKAGTLKAKSVVKKQAITLSGVVRDNLKVKRAMARDLLESLEARIKIIDGAIKAMEAAEKADKE